MGNLVVGTVAWAPSGPEDGEIEAKLVALRDQYGLVPFDVDDGNELYEDSYFHRFGVTKASWWVMWTSDERIKSFLFDAREYLRDQKVAVFTTHFASSTN
jgi:hypothetical protein